MERLLVCTAKLVLRKKHDDPKMENLPFTFGPEAEASLKSTRSAPVKLIQYIIYSACVISLPLPGSTGRITVPGVALTGTVSLDAWIECVKRGCGVSEETLR